MEKVIKTLLKLQRENIKAALIEECIEATLDSDFNNLDMAELARKGAGLTGNKVNEIAEGVSLETLLEELVEHLDGHINENILDGMALTQVCSKKELSDAMSTYLDQLNSD